nr:hypothetical protein [Planosporangium thailandense]
MINHVSHWTPPRWAASGASGAGTREDLMHTLIQHIADLAADAEGQPRRPVPRLDNVLALPDQLRVVANDLIAARPDEATLALATQEVSALNTNLP